MGVYRNVGRINKPDIAQEQRELWLERKRHNKRHYELNRRHPLITAFMDRHPNAGSDLNNLLQFAEETIPIRAIMIRENENPAQYTRPFEQANHEPIRQMAAVLVRAHRTNGKTPEEGRTESVSA